jgi:hypothetical protein
MVNDMSIEPGKTYRMRPQTVNGVYQDRRTFRVDEIVQNPGGNVSVRGALNGENGWCYAANQLFGEPVEPSSVTRIEALEGVLADIMQYDLRDILPPGLLLRMEELGLIK